MMYRHPPECFGEGHHVDAEGKPTDPYSCVRRTQWNIPGTKAWATMPEDIAKCNTSQQDGYCYTHNSFDCEAKILAWQRKVEAEYPRGYDRPKRQRENCR